MKNGEKSGRKSNSRSSGGQAIVEGAAMLVVIVMFFVGLIMFAVNIYATMAYQTKLDTVAREAVFAIKEERYWLGVKRLDYKEEVAKRKARNIADELCKRLGLPGITSFDFENDPTPNGDILQVTIGVSKCELPFGQAKGMFPKFLELRSLGVATAPKTAVYAMAALSCADANNPRNCVQTYVPALAYNYITNSDTGAKPAGDVPNLPNLDYSEIGGSVGCVAYAIDKTPGYSFCYVDGRINGADRETGRRY
jgi:hypothetical protein